MAYATTTITFVEGQINTTQLNEIISGFRLGADSVDGSTVTLNSGTLSIGVITATNIGSDAVTTVKILDGNVTLSKLAAGSVDASKIVALTITGSLIAETTIGWTKTLTADRAAQADMQSETAAHFISPDVLKYHPGVAKAGGIVSLVSGVTTITGGYNITSATDTGSGREITMAVTMANTNYVVLPGYQDSVGDAGVRITGKTTTKFTITPIAGEGAGLTVPFMVFGQLA